jgi:hypothetical protein
MPLIFEKYCTLMESLAFLVQYEQLAVAEHDFFNSDSQISRQRVHVKMLASYSYITQDTKEIFC